MRGIRGNRCPVRVIRCASAFFLLAALLLTACGGAMAAAVPVASPVSANKPAVTVEGNAVVDSNGNPTGFFELSLKVRTTFYLDGTGNLVEKDAAVTTLTHPFRSAAVALRYDADLLTPVSWGYTADDLADGKPGVDVTSASSLNPVYLETQKPDVGISALATVEEYTSAVEGASRANALLVLQAETAGTSVTFDQETVVCVVRFKYDMAQLKMDETSAYDFLRPASTPQGDGAAAGEKCVVWFAEDSDAAASAAAQSVWYQGTKSLTETEKKDRTYFYYSLGSDPAGDPATPPTTDGDVVLATDDTGATSYTANLLKIAADGKPGSLDFTLVNRRSYADNGVDMGNLATVLFYDWDNTLLAVLTVEKGDARAAVNEFVGTKMIHPNILADADQGKVMNSLDRKYTYRGTYPCEGPGVGEVVDNGEKYALTNKLDYSFYRRPTTLVTPDPLDPAPTTEYWQVAANDPAAKDAYPYANGWAIVDDIKNIENVWTTFGVGELKDIDPTADYTTKGTAADYFKLIDFSKLEPGTHYVKACYEPGTSLDLFNYYTIISDMVYERANTYGSTLKGNAYTVKYEYGRYNSGYGVVRTREPSVRIAFTPDNEGNAIESFYVESQVKNVDFMNVSFTPAASVQSVTYMLGDKYQQESYTTGTRRSDDQNEGNIPRNFNEGREHGTYVDRFGTDGLVFRATLNQIAKYATKAAQSGLQEDIDALNTYLTVETFKDLNLRLTETVEVSELYLGTAQIRLLDAFQKVFVSTSCGALVDENGILQLDWHQLQYHFINYSSGGVIKGDGSVRNVTECGSFAWCRLDSCAESVTVVINNLSDLIIAARKANNSAIPNTAAAAQAALDALDMDWVNAANAYSGDTTSLRFRGGKTGNTLAALPYINNADFVTRLKSFVAAADVAGDGLTNMDDVWYQLQHALVNGGAYTPIGGITVDDYWWKSVDNKPLPVDIIDIPTLLQAANEYLGGNTVAWNNLVLADVESVLRLFGSNTGDELSDLTVLTDTTAFKTAIQNLVTAAGADYDKLTWYQVQNYLIKGTLVDDEKVSRYFYWWKDKNQKLPMTLEELLDVVVEVMDSKKLTTAEFGAYVSLAVIDTPWDDPDDPDDLFGLGFRADNAGTHFTSATIAGATTKLRTMFAKAKSAGYYDTTAQKLRLTWDQVQYYLINGAIVDDTTAQGQRYEWRPGGTGDLPVTITSFEELLLAAKQANDGDPTSLDTLTVDFISGQYFRLADGAVLTDSDLTLVKGAVKSAVKYVTDSGSGYGTVTWDQVQYAIINATGTDAATASVESAARYWWKGGGQKVSDWSSLLTAVKGALDGRAAMLNTLTVDQVNNVFYLRADPDGTAYTGGNLATLLSDLQAIVMDAGANYSGLTWPDVQYALLNGGLGDSVDALNESNAKYWWRDGGQKVTDLSSLLAAIQASGEGKDAQFSTLTLEMLNQEPFYFRTNVAGDEFTALSDFKARLLALAGLAGTDCASLTWEQIQYYFIKLSYVSDEVAKPESDAKYWWKDGQSKPVETVTLSDLYGKIIAVMVDKTMTSNEFAAWLTDSMLNDDLSFRKDAGGSRYTAGDVSGAATKFRTSYAKAKAAGYYDAASKTLNLTWDQMQYYLIKSAIVTPEAAAAEGYSWKPDWATAASIELMDLMSEVGDSVEIPDDAQTGDDVPVVPPEEDAEPPIEPEIPENPDTGVETPPQDTELPDVEAPAEPEIPEVPDVGDDALIVPPVEDAESTQMPDAGDEGTPSVGFADSSLAEGAKVAGEGETPQSAVPPAPLSGEPSGDGERIATPVCVPTRNDEQAFASPSGGGGSEADGEGVAACVYPLSRLSATAPPEGEPGIAVGILALNDKGAGAKAPEEENSYGTGSAYLSLRPCGAPPSSEGGNPADLPPAPPKVTLYRRTLRRKKILSLANQGGNNR